jgi:hypothetical protein
MYRPTILFQNASNAKKRGLSCLKILDDIPTFKPTKIKSRGLRARQKIAPTIIGLAVVGSIVAATEFGPILVGCPIKGNISKNTGQRIYHTPGQELYAQTRIDLLSGERWFCSEEDARAAGWRKSRS